MKNIHLQLRNLIGQIESAMIQGQLRAIEPSRLGRGGFELVSMAKIMVWCIP